MKKLLAAIMIIVCILVAGCTPSTNSGDPYIGGTKALTFTFIDGAPPKEVYDDKTSPFSIQVQVKNAGEHDIPAGAGYVQIRGISPLEYGVSDAQLKQTMPELKGAVKNSQGNIVDGSSEILTFDQLNFQGDIAATIGSTIIEALACYDYTTRSTGTMCVKKESVDLTDQTEICKVNNQAISSFSSSGPVQISNVKQNSVGREKVQLTFDITPNRGANEFFFKEGTDCNTLTSNQDRYVVFVDVKPIVGGSIPAQCSGLGSGSSASSGYVTLPNGASRVVTCQFDTSAIQTDATTQFNIELSYRYQQTVQAPLMIKDTGNNARNN
jgi:hypothetical protein